MVLVVVIIRVVICVDGPLSVSSSVVTGDHRRRREWITVDGWIESNRIESFVVNGWWRGMA